MPLNTPIAVVGMSGLFPGASNLKDFWQNITNQVSAVVDVSQDRWSVDPDAMYHPGIHADKTYSKRCCLIDDFNFDSAGINLDQPLIDSLDPLYHIVLHCGREAIGGLRPSSLNRQRTGVILAAIALPTDTTAAVTHDILGTAFDENLSLRKSGGCESKPRRRAR